MKMEPYINLFFSPDKETCELVNRICREVKVYNSHVDYKSFEELIKKRTESYAVSGNEMIDNEGLSLVFSPCFLDENIQDRSSSLCITPLKEELRLIVRKGNAVVNEAICEMDILGLYGHRQKYESEFLYIDWNKELYLHLRLLMHLSFVLAWHRCRGIVIHNYAENPLKYIIQDMQVFLKGVLNDFLYEEFIFHPFRQRG